MPYYFYIFLLAMGAFSGFSAGLLGVGGGMVLVPLLSIVFQQLGMPTQTIVHAAIATAMTTILFTSLSSMRAHHRHGAIKWPLVWQFVPGILIGGLLAGGGVFALINPKLLAGIFAVFVSYSAYKMLRPSPTVADRQMPGPFGTMAVGTGIGFISGLVGAGGGFISVPFMARCNVPLKNAIATSAALGFPIALANSTGYVWAGLQTGGLHDGMLGFIYIPALLTLVCASVLTAHLGAKASHALPVATLKKYFAGLLLVLAIYMVFKLF